MLLLSAGVTEIALLLFRYCDECVNSARTDIIIKFQSHTISRARQDLYNK